MVLKDVSVLLKFVFPKKIILKAVNTDFNQDLWQNEKRDPGKIELGSILNPA